MVILDGSMQYADQLGKPNHPSNLIILGKQLTQHLGFMSDHRRSNVAMTRATDFFWIIGGSMKCLYKKNEKKTLAPFARLKRELEGSGQVHRFYAD